MEEIFATKIIINDVLNIKDFEIPLSETERRHLIITGKNGSGKTTLLRELKNSLSHGLTSTNENLIDRYPTIIPDPINYYKSEFIFNVPSSVVTWDKFIIGEFLITFFEAKRDSELIAPSGIKKIVTKPFYKIEDNAGKDFIQHMVNLKADRLFAQEENEVEEPKKIDDWFTAFEERILDIFETTGSQLVFDRKNYNFNIVEPGKDPYNLNQLSDGYSSILNIVSELIMRIEEHHTKSYDVQGIVLIDEIETHLHIELQKKILPFLTSFFPKIQFIVTTHSPFVITSIKDAVVCDLEKKIVINDDLSGYSYDAIVEGYFDSDKYSSYLKQRVEEYEILKSKDFLDKKEEMRLRKLKKYLHSIPKFLSEEFVDGLTVKLQQIESNDLNKAI